jgi:phosphonate transport system substrate-binding protein
LSVARIPVYRASSTIDEGRGAVARRPAVSSMSGSRKLVVFVLLVLFSPGPAFPRPLQIGSTHNDPSGEIKNFYPFAEYLGKQLQSEGIDAGKVVVVPGVRQMADLMKRGKVDLYIDSPFPSVAVSRLSGSKFLLRRWKSEVAEYHALIFARKDSGINQLDDLKGKLIAFEQDFSSTGYFLPKLAFLQKKLRLEEKFQPAGPVSAQEIGYVFSGDDENTLLWVLRNKVSAGAIDNVGYRRKAGKGMESLKIIHETLPIPRHIVSYRADLPLPWVAKIKETLIQMDRSEIGRKVLKDFEKTKKFDELPSSSMAGLLNAGRYIDSEYGVR